MIKEVKDRGPRRWLINSQGQTFSVIVPPAEFLMGSPSMETGRRTSDELPHKVLLKRSFIVATKEVTREQYARFVNETRTPEKRNDDYSPDRLGPQVRVTWFEAAAYCNWLSEKDLGLTASECCYERRPKEEYAEAANCLERPGYRLPTEEEWEYACRAGAVTSRYYGESPDLLEHYAWYSENSNDLAQACGQLIPNDLGLFDMLGNAFEWCQTREATYRMYRGGAFTFKAPFLRAAYRAGSVPTTSNPNYGIRLVRTYP